MDNGHFAYRKVIKLWGFSSAPMQKKMERFPYFSWWSFKRLGTAYDGYHFIYKKTKVQFTV